MLVEFGKIPAWIPIIVLAREFIVSGYRLVAVEKGGKVIAASKWGKLKNSNTNDSNNISIFRLISIWRMF